MSRSGYNDDWDEADQWEQIKWRGQVASAMYGKRGQRMLRDLIKELDAMPIKRLIDKNLQREGEVCTLGCLFRARGIDTTLIDGILDYNDEDVAAINGIAKCLNIAVPLAREVMYLNDEGRRNESPEQRWERMRSWVARQIIVTPEEAEAVELDEE